MATPTLLQRLARLGAELRVRQLRLELESIYRKYPDLRSKPRPGYTDDGTMILPGKGKRRRMSASSRKAVSRRIKRYWAARRAEKDR
jgi:hypothetical protein